MASTSTRNALEPPQELILPWARELLIRSLYSVRDNDLRDEIEIWLEEFWKKYGSKATPTQLGDEIHEA